MRPSRNALFGYSYQKMISFLILAKMDVERKIEQIEFEAAVSNNFDDVTIHYESKQFYCQMKDFSDISLNDIKRVDQDIIIKGAKHRLSDNINVLFIKNIDLVPDSEILGFPALNLDGVFIVSMSRESAWSAIGSLYGPNDQRIAKLEYFFEKSLDKRTLLIKRSELPHIELFSTELMDKTINLQELVLSDSKIIRIEGKPGVGKSHLVNQLKIENKILYRFWISNQDKHYKERLMFGNFISNITKELFNVYQTKTEDEIIARLRQDNLTLIIDGLDHVENYNSSELDLFITFVNKVGFYCKVIVLSRPLKTKIDWETKMLNDWNFNQTEKYLNEFCHITEYKIIKSIYEKTKGYPILVNFFARHYKSFNELPDIDEINGLNDYYNNIIKDVNIKTALILFLTSRSYFMISEINNFLEGELAEIVNEFISSYPYLFEIRLNRISLLHDSFNTYLREQNINYESRKEKVHRDVFDSIIKGEKRYLCRFINFELDPGMNLEIIKKYASIIEFKKLMENCIDFEAIQSFYSQIRQAVSELNCNSLSLIQYYDLSLIDNIIQRNHISSLNQFLYTYIKCLLRNGINEEDITSSDYLFSFLYYIRNNDIELIKNVLSDNYFDTENFYEQLLYDIDVEEMYYEHHEKVFMLTKEDREIISSHSEYEIKDRIQYILVNSYINGIKEKSFDELYKAIILYIDEGQNDSAILLMEKELAKYGVREFFAHSLLENAKNKLESLGQIRVQNDYRILTLNNYIDKYAHRGSFDLLKRVQNYIRLSLKDNRTIDISSISRLFTMYYERKDYSVINLYEALKVFETIGMIDESESCKLIVKAQSLSEKGIRNLLEDYIETHNIDILKLLEDNFDLEDLQVMWFELPVEYIDFFSSTLLKVATSQLIRFHSGSRRIRMAEVENALVSNKKTDVIELLSFLKMTLEVPKKHPLIKELQKTRMYVEIVKKESDAGYRSTSFERYTQGILTSSDIDLIKELGLKSYELAAFNNGNLSLLADLDMFSIYDKNDIKGEIYHIIYFAYLGKLNSINMYGNLYYFVGNFPKMLYQYDIDVDWAELYSSFRLFLELSLIN